MIAASRWVIQCFGPRLPMTQRVAFAQQQVAESQLWPGRFFTRIEGGVYCCIDSLFKHWCDGFWMMVKARQPMTAVEFKALGRHIDHTFDAFMADSRASDRRVMERLGVADFLEVEAFRHQYQLGPGLSCSIVIQPIHKEQP